MIYDRRRLLVGATSMAAVTAVAGPAAALDANTQTFSNQRGLPNLDRLAPNLQLLLQAQQNATTVPATRPGFVKYIAGSPIVQAIQQGHNSDFYHLMAWHAFVLDLSALDHTTVAGSNDPTFAEQYGPLYTARAFAIFHLALFEAVNAIYRTYRSYRGLQTQILADAGAAPSQVTPSTASVPLAIAYAADGVLEVLYKNKRQFSQVVLEVLTSLAAPVPDSARKLGTAIGKSAAARVLQVRQYNPATGAFGDGSRDVAGVKSLSMEPTYAQLQAAGLLPRNPTSFDWQPDPIVKNDVALGGYWDKVKPFALKTIPILPPFPAAGTPTFQATYVDVRTQGGEPHPPAIAPRYPTGTLRTGTQPGTPLDGDNHSFVGVFWGYDATALLCAPPRLFNMVATSVALNERPITRTDTMSSYLSLINMAMCDAGIAGWTNKFHHHIARPVTYIRSNRPDEVVLGTPNSHWTPQGSPNSNGPTASSNFTPPFPSYPSGHAVFVGALFQTMRRFFDTRRTGEPSFQLVSDEYNGVNRDSQGNIRPFVRRTFSSFGAAEAECARSRVWNGVHWQIDGDTGVAMGNQVADCVFDNTFGTA